MVPPYGTFRHCDAKYFRRKILIPPPLIETFSIPEIIETLNFSPYGNFRHFETNNFRRKILIFPPLLPKLHRYPKLIKHLRIPLTEVFRHCETKNFRWKILIPPPPLIHKLFRYRIFSETQHRMVHLRKNSASWDKKNSTENRKS